MTCRQVLSVLPRGLSRRARFALVVGVAFAMGAAAAFALTLYDRSGGSDCQLAHAYAAMVLSDGATGYWRLDETTGTTARNSASGGRDGKYVGKDVLDRPGKSLDDRAVALDGYRNYVVIPSQRRYRDVTRWSVEAWVDPLSPVPKRADIAFLTPAWRSSSLPFVLGYGSFDGAFSDARHAWVGFYSSNGFYRELLGTWSRIGDVTGTWSRAADPGVLPLETWTHLVGTYDGNAIRLYKNGDLVSSAAVVGRPPAAGKVPLYIGSRWWLGSRQFFSGSVSDVALYSTALTPAQVRAHYRAVKEC